LLVARGPGQAVGGRRGGSWLPWGRPLLVALPFRAGFGSAGAGWPAVTGVCSGLRSGPGASGFVRGTGTRRSGGRPAADEQSAAASVSQEDWA
jgi:hypothetical protein